MISGKKPKTAGMSSDSGFCVIKIGVKTVNSPNYSKWKEEDWASQLKRRNIICWIGIWIFLCLLWISPTLYSGKGAPIIVTFIIIASLLSFFAAMYLSIMLFYTDIAGKNTPEYHACEHKVCHLLEREIQPTLDNLKKMPRVTLRCGSYDVGLFGMLPLTMGIAYLLSQFSFVTMYLSSVLIFGIASVLGVTTPLLLQYLFATREPSQEKLEEALEVAKQFYK